MWLTLFKADLICNRSFSNCWTLESELHTRYSVISMSKIFFLYVFGCTYFSWSSLRCRLFSNWDNSAASFSCSRALIASACRCNTLVQGERRLCAPKTHTQHCSIFYSFKTTCHQNIQRQEEWNKCKNSKHEM